MYNGFINEEELAREKEIAALRERVKALEEALRALVDSAWGEVPSISTNIFVGLDELNAARAALGGGTEQ